jgi:hypothetical protein
MFFAAKKHHRPFESYKTSSNHPIGLKICQHTQIVKIKIAMKLRRGSFFDLPNF